MLGPPGPPQKTAYKIDGRNPCTSSDIFIEAK